ncbi:sensor histidine kinase [Paenibacillus nasutitermitis]|uniref:HAMP domain-containing protein n=1 Tax=Paenibacillus nasutitermitis TaxID=1652958 RepID=A0A916YLB1_9BACL|nr:histidine kinase [Paenibacillus nasutitermitis]GGD51267.1 hypothetical protein GCM10010911_06030 [Paenibacillus nasutitermitis]
MPFKMTIFRKFIVILILLILPVFALYTYSNQVSVDVVRKEMKESNLRQLSFFLSQAEMTFEQLSVAANTIGGYQVIEELTHFDEIQSKYEKVKVKQDLMEKLKLLGASSNWTNQFTVYSPTAGTGVTTLNQIDYSTMFSPDSLSLVWKYRQIEQNGELVKQFVKHTVYPGSQLIVEVSFTIDNILTMLDQIKMKGKNDPFLFHEGFQPIVNRTADQPLVGELVGYLKDSKLGDSDTAYISLHGQNYMVNYVKSDKLNWFLIDYVPLEKVLKPITKSSLLFYSSIGLLLLMSIAFALLLYKNVQIPIYQLLQGVKKMGMGSFSTRLENTPGNEFGFIFNRFNQMGEQIEQLIENVYAEKIRSREATLKQLQSQINPHFLYNSLAFVKSMTELDEKEAVIAMTLNLSKYYRYTTRVENQETTLREELELVTHYLTIQSLQMQRFDYQIDIPDAMLDIPIPRLLLQPIVENAIIHGIEPELGWGELFITGVQEGKAVRITVENSGSAITPELLEELENKLELPLSDDVGCGQWNVHQRLKTKFGPEAGILLTPSQYGGLCVTLRWETLE